jgi:hypothetical protein
VGKLAERLSDPARAGVYRIETAEAVEEAAALNRYPLLRVSINGSTAPALAAAAADDDRVVLLTGFETLARERPEEIEALLARLRSATEAGRAREARIFIAFLDPSHALPQLPPLYNWRRHAGPPQVI